MNVLGFLAMIAAREFSLQPRVYTFTHDNLRRHPLLYCDDTDCLVVSVRQSVTGIRA